MTPDPLLAAILDRPDDDAPRLIYADWLDEQGQSERAEFIRVQIELATFKGHTGIHKDDGSDFSCRVCTLRRREKELWNASRLNGAPHPWIGTMGFRIRSNWLSSYDAPVMTIHPGGQRVEFRLARGFVHTVACPMAAWLKHGPAVVRACPVERVEITDKRPSWYSRGIMSIDNQQVPGTGWHVGGAPVRYELPEAIALYMAAYRSGTGRVVYVGYHDTVEAMSTLSAACLSWAKSA